MASSSHEHDLLPDQTEGFKVGEKKTMDEYHKLGMGFSPYTAVICCILICFGVFLFFTAPFVYSEGYL